MKNKLHFLTILVFISNGLFGQFEIDAGADTIICEAGNAVIGGNPTASGGVAPYIYTWTTELKKFGSHTYGASYYLDDTTNANPMFVNRVPPLLDTIKFNLTVTDFTGTKLSDSINIRLSTFFFTLINFTRTINQGDTVSLDHNIHDGIEPLKYSWSPNYNISDTSISNPLVWPGTSTNYQVVATDSIGCVSPPDVCEVIVNPAIISQTGLTRSKSTIFPNPIDCKSRIYIDRNNQGKLSIRVMNSGGQVIIKDKIIADSYNIGEKISRSGSYLYMILEDNQVIDTGQFVKISEK